MTRWIRQLFRRPPVAPVVKPHRARLGLHRLEDRDTPATFTVQNGLDSGAGSLREAVALANANPGADTIIFGVGVGDVVLTSGQLALTDTSGATTISGPSGGTHVVRRNTDSGTPDFRIFRIPSGVTAVFDNLRVSNGRANVGGGILSEGTLTITNTTISWNTAGSNGGGIVSVGPLTVTNSTISGNTSETGGGGIEAGATLTITNSTVSGNSSNASGGGIFFTGTLTVTNSTISGNTANASGGGVFAAGATTLTNVTITGNRSDYDNTGAGTGGGLLVSSGTPLLRNTLIAGNRRGNGGTTRDDVSGAVHTISFSNLIGDGTGLTGINHGVAGNQIGSGALPINPLLGPLASNGGPTQLHPLLDGSPAINAGNNTAASSLTSDGRGAPFVRVSGGTVDIGAFEMQATPALVVNNTGDADDGNIGAGQLTLREAVRVAHNPGADTITFAPGLGDVVLTTAELTLSHTSGATTISGPSGGTHVVRRSTAIGTPDFRIFSVNTGVTAAFNNLTISNGNSGSVGGGGILSGGALTVTNSTVSGNTGSDGGGIWSVGPLTLTNSTISGNTSNASGGGIWSSAPLTLTNSTIWGNTTSGFGGGLRAAGITNQPVLTNVTITGNRSDNNNSGGEGGGGLSQQAGSLTLNNTLIAGNFRGMGITRDDMNGVATASLNNLIGDGTGLFGITNGTNGNLIGTAGTPINPLLLPLANNGGVTQTHALGQNSPALGKASASVANYSVYDQRGTARDLGAPDIGAYEVQHPLAPVGVPTTMALLYAPKPSATANEAFVKGLYQSTLLRAPDAGGQAHWLSQLANGMTREQVANGFVNSTENRTNQVTFFYRYFLSREPDSGGLADWVGRLQSGQDEGQVMTGFILSAEFSGNNNNTQFVNLMYYALLGREADSGGLNNWLNQLNTGTSRETVVFFFLRSEEGLNRVVRSLFQAYLKREADAGAVVNFRTALLSGTTFGQAATSILGGQEFFNNAAANMT